MDTIQAYVNTVGRKLPGRISEDVKKELHSLILDTLEEKYPQSNGNWSKEEQIAVLRDFSSPSEMAASYAPSRQYLVGPKLFPLFQIAALAVIGALLLSTMVGYFVSMQPLPGGGFDWETLVVTVLEGLFASIVTGLGSVTLTFAILERVLPESVRISLQDEEWDPEQLELPEKEEKIQIVPQILGIVFFAACLVLFNIFPDKVGYYSYLTSDTHTGWVVVPALADVFFSRFLPLINLYWIFTILLFITQLILREWNRVLRILEFGISILGLLIVVQLMNGPSIFDLGMNTLLPPEVLDVYQTVNGIFSVMWQIGLVFILAGAVFGSIRSLLRIFDLHTLDDIKRAVSAARQ